MSDSRPRVSAAKAINLEQLAAEVGAPLTATIAADRVTVLDVVVADADAPVTQAQLMAAVDAHLAQPTEVDRAAELRAKASAALAANDAFLALAAPSNVEILAHMRRLTRENSAVIRLVIGELDSTAGT